MKNPKRISFLRTAFIILQIYLLTGLLYSLNAHAEKMDNNMQDMVVNKLTHVLEHMDSKDSSWLPTQQRLADLLAERARTRFMKEVEVDCENCKGSKEDRQRAIKIYEKLLVEVPLNDHGPLLFQLGHLYELADEQAKAISLFERIITEAKQKSISASIVSRSHAALGDLLFQKTKFKEAHEHYVIALKDKTLENKTLAIYNMAWCDFNSGKLNSAISTLEALLKDPTKITKDSSGTDSGSVYDPVFHADIVRDLGSFYSRRNITAKDILAYENFTPKEQRKELILNFSQEADRIGQKQAAHDILERYLSQPDLLKSERLEAFVRLAQVNYDRGEVTESTQDFAKAAAAFKNSDCKEASKCQDLQKTMKRYVTELHRSKKLKPDQDLLNAYLTYTKTFPNDKVMAQRGSQVAMDLGHYAIAVEIYKELSEQDSLSKSEQNEALLNEVGAAEKSNDLKIQKEAYSHFLRHASKDEKYFKVRYQQAYLQYQDKNLKEAIATFDDLAHEKTGAIELRKKAADLVLDSYVQLRDDEHLREKAWEYAELFPSHKAEFSRIAYKSLINNSAAVANNPKSTKSEYKNVMNAILKTPCEEAPSAERRLIYSNLKFIAQKLHDDEVYAKSMMVLLALPDNTKIQKTKYQTQLIGFYEAKLDFKNAYKITQQMWINSDKDQEFKLGTLADLADQSELDPSRHYRRALKLGLSGPRALQVRSRLVLLSNSPENELKFQASELRKKPALLNETTLFVLSKTNNSHGIKSVLAMKEMKNLSAARFVEKQHFYAQQQTFQENIAQQKIKQDSDKSMAKSIQLRIKFLKTADQNLDLALKLKDITAELLALNTIAIENQRLVKDLVQLEVPKQLNNAQRQQYIDAMKMKSKPFLVKSREAQKKIQEIWNSSRALSELSKEYKMARPEIQKLLVQEMDILESIPGQGPMKTSLSEARGGSSYSANDLASARKTVSENPENLHDIQNLKTMELKVGHPLMPSYLEARLNHLQRGKNL